MRKYLLPNNKLARVLISIGILYSNLTWGQSALIPRNDIRFWQLDNSPLSINPAYVGKFDGKLRINAAYQESISNQQNPSFLLNSFNASLDLPIINHNENYIAISAQYLSDSM